MKRFFFLISLLLFVPSLLAGEFSASTKGKSANPTLSYTAKLDSAKFVFYYPYNNAYKTVRAYPKDNDSLNVVDTTVAGMNLDSVGGHWVKITYYPHNGSSGIIYGLWEQKPDSGYVKGLTSAKIGYIDVSIASRSSHSASDVWSVGTRALTDKANFTLASSEYVKFWNLAFNTAFTVGSMGDSLNNATYVQGSGGGGATASAIADTFGNRGWMPGIGTNACSLMVLTINDSQAVAMMPLKIYNSTLSMSPAQNTTDNEGLAFFKLSDGSYRVFTELAGYRQLNDYDTFTVSGVSKDTIWVETYNPAEPPPANTCKVWARIKNLDNTPTTSAIVDARINTVPLQLGGVLINGYSKIDTTDANGYWQMYLYPNSILTPDDTKYEFIIYSAQGKMLLKTKVTVPDQNQWELNF
jgi:hypothetical protein